MVASCVVTPYSYGVQRRDQAARPSRDEMPTCPGCGRSWSSCACDRLAARWLEEEGHAHRDGRDRLVIDADLPDPDQGRMCGDVAPSVADRRRLGESPELVARLREYASWQRARRVALRHEELHRREESLLRARELAQLDLHLDVLDHWVCGEYEEVKELGRRHGHGHPWAVELRQRIIDAAYRLGSRGERRVIAVVCACGCGELVVWSGSGRPPRYKGEHRHRAKARRRRAARMRSRTGARQGPAPAA